MDEYIYENELNKSLMLEKFVMSEMAVVTKGELPGLKIVVFGSSHPTTSHPNFHVIGEGYEAEFRIPDRIPEQPEQFEFLGYKRNDKNYSMKDLRKIIDWFPNDNKRFPGTTNFQTMRNLWGALNPDDVDFNP